MNQKFENNLFQLEVKTENGESLFDIETVAKSLGFTQIKNNKEYTRWETVNKYLKKYLSQDVGKGDFISEAMVYKLAFKANNALAEKFQDWLATDVLPKIRKTGSYIPDTSRLSPELQMFQGIFQAVANQELATKKLESKIDNISEIVGVNSTNWREDSNRLINKIVRLQGNTGQAHQEVRSTVFLEVDKRAGVSLQTRLTNKRRRMADEGASKSRRDKLTKVDVIADDKKLIEIYVAVVKEYAIKYNVWNNDF